MASFGCPDSVRYMKQYTRLSEGEREEISRYLAAGTSQSDIARFLGRHRSTISRETREGSCNRHTYRAGRAQRRACRNATKRKAGKRKLFANDRLWHYVVAGLRKRWSPDQVEKRLAMEYPTDKFMHISSEAIYATVYVLPKGALKKELTTALRREHKRRRRCKAQEKSVVERNLENMVMIDDRPLDVADRVIPGHWEGDLIIGRNRQSAMGTLTERSTRTTILVPLKSKRAHEVRKAFAREMRKLPKHMSLSLTYDQGREMAEHILFTRETKVQVYFAHKACPWERGTNENTNGLIRQFFPKGTDLSKVSRKEVKRVQHLLNGRPRKVLGYYTPYEVFNKLLR